MVKFRKPFGTQSVNVLLKVIPCWRNPLCKLPSKKQKCYSLQSHQYNRFDEPADKLRNWYDSIPFVATSLAKDVGVVGTDAAHKIKHLALELNPTIPDLEIKPKHKSIRKKFEGTSIPCLYLPTREN